MMGKHIKIAFDATPSLGAGVCLIYEGHDAPQYSLYARSHAYVGTDPATFQMKNGINVLKQFKRYFDQHVIVDIYCDSAALDSEDHPDTLVLKHQIRQLEDRWECDIHHNGGGDGQQGLDDEGSSLIQAANELSGKRKAQCEEILAKLGAKPMRIH